MAANNRKFKPDKTRQKIRSGMIAKKLEDHVEDPEKTPMSTSQVNAAKTLLAKTLPDLSSSDITNHEPEQTYDDLLQGLIALAGPNWKEVLELCNLEYKEIDNESNKELN